MIDMPSLEAIGIAFNWQELEPEIRMRVSVFFHLVAGKDKCAIEILDMLVSEEIMPMDALDYLDKYMASKH